MSRWKLTKHCSFSASHALSLPYDSPCKRLHGHNYSVTVVVESDGLDGSGMVIDFAKISKLLANYDHTHLNDSLVWAGCDNNPTAENIAKLIHDEVAALMPAMSAKVTVAVSESPSSSVEYTD